MIKHATTPTKAKIVPPIEIRMDAQIGRPPTAAGTTTYLLTSQSLLHGFS